MGGVELNVGGWGHIQQSRAGMGGWDQDWGGGEMGLVPRALWGRRGSRAGSGGSIIGVWGGETRESEVRCGAVGCCGVGLGLVWSPDLSPPPPIAPFTNQLCPLPPHSALWPL